MFLALGLGTAADRPLPATVLLIVAKDVSVPELEE